MKATTENSNEDIYINYESTSSNVNGVTSDLEIVLEKLNSKEIISSEEILFYIDATNGNVFVSGFNSSTGEIFENKGINVELHDLWEENDNSMDFDEIVTESIKQAFATELGKKSKEIFTVFYQTEIDEPVKLN